LCPPEDLRGKQIPDEMVLGAAGQEPGSETAAPATGRIRAVSSFRTKQVRRIVRIRARLEQDLAGLLSNPRLSAAVEARQKNLAAAP
jgi:hypothetical protein